MNLKPLLQKLESSQIFEKFKETNPESFLCAGFFIIDLKQKIKEYSLDYKSGEDIFSFNIPFDSSLITMKKEPVFDNSKPLMRINTEIKIELDDLREIVEKERQRHEIKGELEKIIAVLQNNENQSIWNLTCMCGGFSILTVHLDSKSGRIIKSEKRSLFDFARPAGM